MVEWTNDSDVIAERKKLDNSFSEEKLKKLVAPPLGSREKKKTTRSPDSACHTDSWDDAH